MSEVKLHPDYQPLNGATGRFDRKIPVYDDGSGNLYAFYQACGNSVHVAAIVRADSWEDAHSICEDEFYPEAPSWQEMADEQEWKGTFEEMTEHCNGWQESYGYRPNGPSTSDHTTNEHGHGIYSKDVNGCDSLVKLTEEILEAHEIKLDAPVDWEGISSAVMDLEWTCANGIYIPHLFCANVSDEHLAKQDERVRECIANLKPESSVHGYEHYDEDWATVLDNYNVNGHTLHQNGDLWSVDSNEVGKLTDYYGIDDDDVNSNLFGA